MNERPIYPTSLVSWGYGAGVVLILLTGFALAFRWGPALRLFEAIRSITG